MEEPVVTGTEITPPVEPTPPIEAPIEPVAVDPGQLEGRPKHEPPVGSPRWNEVYHKAKETERALEAERAEKAALEARIAELQAQAATPPPALPPQPPMPPTTPQAPPVDPNVLFQQMKAARAEAFRNMDMERAALIQEDIDNFILQQSRPNPQQIASTFRQMEVDREVGRFIQTVSWFTPTTPDGRPNPTYDPIMKGAAISLEEQLAPTWNGTYSDLLAEVKKQVEARLSQPPIQRPVIPGVSGVGGAIPPSSPQTKLSPDESRVARMMFGNSPDPEKAYLDAKGVR